LREGKGDIAMLGNILKVTVDSVEAPGVKGLAVEGSGLQGLGGRTLFEAVFCTEELKRWYEELEGPLLIEADAELQEVKWEMMHDGEGFMALSRGMARVLDTPDRSRRGEREGGRLEVLVALASPVLDLRLADPHEERQPHVLDLEDRAEIFAGLEGHDFAAEFRVLRHVTRVRLDEELSREADVLHLTAHGQRGRVALEDRAWRLEEARADELAADAARGGVSLAVLESCLSAAAEPEGGPSTALAMLEGGVPMVVGMTEAVWVEAAKAFTQSLYRLLAQGHDVVQAVRLARRNTEAACRRESGASEDWKLPCLYLSKQVLGDGPPKLRAEGVEGEVTVEGDVSPWPDPLLRPSERFVGRRDKLVQIGEALQPEALEPERREKLLLTGHGGIGKTELALQAAARLRHRFRGGMVCVTGRTEMPELEVKPSAAAQLLVVGSEREFVLRIGRDLGLELTGEEEDADLVRGIAAAANGRQVLLVLDNLEPFGEEGLVMPLLRALGGRCRVLATSRHELPGAEIECVDVTALAPSEAVEMVWREAAAKPVEIVQAGRLAQACRYTPMAIRLAVGRIASPRETEEQVIGAFEEFAGGTEDLVRYAFEGALGAADEETRLVFACAALFVQPPRREALAAATGLDEEGLGRGIAEAVRLSLLEPVGERDRFELLPLARRVAERELKKLTDVEQRRRRAAEECVGFVARMGALIRADMMGQSLGQRGPERRDGVVFTGVELAADAQRAGISQLEQEWASAVEFARCAFEAGEWKLVPGFSEGVGPFLTLRGMYGEYLELGPMALEAARKGGCRKAETVELNNMGNVHQQQGRYEEAMGLYEQSLEIFRELGDQRGEGQALGNMGLVHEQQGQYDEAMRLYERSLWVFREVGASDGERRTLGNMAIVHCHQGRYEEAIDLCAQNLEICRKLGDRRGEGAVLNTMAEVARRQGRYNEAMALYEKGLEIAQQLGDRNMESATLNNMAIVHSEHGRHDEAMELYERTLEISEDVGDRDGRARALVNMGAVHEQRGGYDEAMRLYEQGLEIFRELGDREGEGQALYDMAIVHQWQGRYEQAMGLYEQSLEICRELGDGRGECQRLNNMAVVHVQEGRLDEALGAFEQSLEICRELGDGHGEGQTLNNMAGVHQLQGRYEEAMGLYEQSLAIRRELGDRLGEGQTLMNMGVLAENSGNADKAREHWQEALEALEGLGVPEEEQVRELLEELGDGQ